MEILHTDKAPAAIGPYSQAIETGGLIFASGQLGLIPDTGALAHSMAQEARPSPLPSSCLVRGRVRQMVFPAWQK